MYSQQNYHALHHQEEEGDQEERDNEKRNIGNISNSNSNSNLWDQLNDQQSREVQQHQSRFHAAPVDSRTRKFNIVWSMAQSTLERCGTTISIAYGAAQQAWRNHPRRQQQQQQQQQRYNTELDWLDQQFGLGDDVGLRPHEHEHGHGHEHGHEHGHGHPQHSQPQTPQPTQDGQPNPGYPFVLLRNKDIPSHRQAIQQQQQQQQHLNDFNILMVGNMDVFLTHLYQYYYNRGLVPMVCTFLVEFTSLLFTLWLSRILMKDLDWQQLVSTCKDEDSCHANWSDYYYHNSSNDSNNSLSWFHYGLVQGYTLLFLAYAAFLSWSFWKSLQHALTCQYIVHDVLGISKRKLQGGAVLWDTIVTKLMEQVHQEQQIQNSTRHNNPNTSTTPTPMTPTTTTTSNNNTATQNGGGDYRTTALQNLDPLLIAQRIMRKENFLIAFWNQGSQTLLDTKVGNRTYWCASLEWCLYTCVLNFMFNHKYEIRPAFLLDAASLQRRLQVCGIVHAILLPFLILFVLLHFLFRNAYDFKTTRQYMGNKQWSRVAQWHFREFNELPHVLEQRLDPSYEAAEKYLQLFGQSEWMAALGQLLVFLGGAVGGLLLVLGVINDAILLHVQLWGRNLLWYAGIAGIVFGVGKGLLPTKEAQPSVTRNLFGDMDAALKNVSTYTHYYPEHWKGRGWDALVYKSFGNFFDSKVKLFVHELIALVLAPYILMFKLSNCAPAICDFCLVVKSRVPAAGDVCGYSTFDFDTFQDEVWEGRTLGQSVLLRENNNDHGNDNNSIDNNNNNNTPGGGGETLAESIMRTGNLEDATRQHPKPRSREGKMEKSFFSFQAAHPSWKCSPSGQSLVDRVEDYRNAELAAMTRERDWHINAAARQLETLVRLEQQEQQQQQQQQPPRQLNHQFPEERLYDSHIPRVLPPSADAGAGSHHTTPDQQRQSPQAYPSNPSHQHQHQHQHPPSPPSVSSLQSIRPRSSNSSTPSTTGGLPFAGEHPPPANSGVLPLQLGISQPQLQPPLPTDQLTKLHHPQHHPMEPSFPNSITTTATALGASSSANHLRAGLSTELRRLLTMSTLDATDSVLQEASTPLQQHHPPPSATTNGRTAERQYYWLERFHEHLESQQQQQQESVEEPAISRSMPLHPYPPSSSQQQSRPSYNDQNNATTSASSMV